ncbi:MAG: ABC transporter ATP-binding protein [Dermatophilus congolensis]|nr:ABC transporter ATP-binding protein [Dermatophilus congolensis]
MAPVTVLRDEQQVIERSALPPLFTGRRRRQLAVLVALGLVQAGLSVFTAYLTPTLLTGGPAALSAVALVIAGLCFGGARIAERVVSEDLGQDYVREIRSLLVTSALAPTRSANLGITVARTTNDLTAVKNWVSLGIAPIASGVPLIVAVVVAMLLLTPQLAVVVTATLVIFGVLMLVLASPLRRRARSLRKVRGAMAGQIADTVTAAQAIRVSGGIDREVERIDKLSAKVSAAAHERALVSGAMRGAAASVTAMMAVLVAVAGAWWHLGIPEVTTAVFIAGMLAAPVSDLGRVGEYRQNMMAAKAVLEPVLARAHALKERERRRRRERRRNRLRGSPAGLARGAVHVADIVDREGSLPELVAAPGARVLLTGTSPKRTQAVLSYLTGDRHGAEGWVVVDGRQIGDLPAAERRRLVGFASRTVPIERGTVARVVRYRVPSTETPVDQLLDRVGLLPAISALPDGTSTTLRRGGEPLDVPEQARLRLAKALADDPPLLLLDHVDEQLDQAGREMLKGLLRDYPGCVILRSSDPTAVLDCYDVWNVDETAPGLVIALPAADLPWRGPRATSYLPGTSADPFGPPVRISAVDVASLRHDESPEVEQDDDDE